MLRLLLPLSMILSGCIILQAYEPDGISTYLDNSVPYIGTDAPRMDGIDGSGIMVAVIDTGVDFEHPDLLGWGPDGKVVGGYNFVDADEPPLDTDGHGTQVAGVIAADGHAKGVAPKAKILAYKVSEDGEEVQSDLIVRAIEMAIEDGADIINISLGVNKTNSKIDRAVSHALDEGMIVIVAAGNDGPGNETIGSPGRNPGAITVGATHNNLTSSVVATLETDGGLYTVIPMVGSPTITEPISERMVFGGYGRAWEMTADAAGAIVLVERGSDTEGELLYFSIKERNAADAGAIAMIVYNNDPGLFLGELAGEFAGSGYEPRIPVVSIDRKDGLEIRDGIGDGHDASLHMFYNPDSVAHFSSRGPVSPFYIKPDILAPGAYINTTHGTGYNLTSGTSYAAPHASGAAALLLQKNPGLLHHEVKSLLMTTASPVHDAQGGRFAAQEAGSGRMDIKRAYNADLIISPPSLVMSMSYQDPSGGERLALKPMDGTLGDVMVGFDGPEHITFSHSLDGDALDIRIGVTGDTFGDYEGRITIAHDGIEYAVPVLIHYTQGSISAVQQDDMLHFSISHPEPWSFAKITVTNGMDGSTDTVTTVPGGESGMRIFGNGEYWVDARIRAGGESASAFDTITVTTLRDVPAGMELYDMPERQIAIVMGAMAAIGVFGLILRRQHAVRA